MNIHLINTAVHIQERVHKLSNDISNSEEEEVIVDLIVDLEELSLMESMGLPTSFGSTKRNVVIQPKQANRGRVGKRKNKKEWKLPKRYRLFSRFDEGIKLDDESWYSVTPEKIAKHIADRFVDDGVNLILDAFCGAGGNTIQFALSSPNIRVIAVDIDENKIEMAKHNAAIYGVEHKIDFVVADFLTFARSLATETKQNIDAVFLSPPWGGPDYKKTEKYCLDMMTPNVLHILEACRSLTSNFAFYLPRNIDETELLKIVEQNVEIEQNFINHKVLTVTAYFGKLIKCDSN